MAMQSAAISAFDVPHVVVQTAKETEPVMEFGHGYESDGKELPAFLRLKEAAAGFRSLESRMGGDETENHHMVVAQVHGLLAAIVALENSGVEKHAIHAAIAEVRQIHAQSPIIARMQNWPRGYAGDYETIEALLSGCCVSERGTLAYHLERYVLDCPASQQHRNKVLAQADLIRSTVTQNPNASIMVVACGSSPDLRLLAQELKAFRGELWLNDVDEGALARSTVMVSASFPQVRSAVGNVVELLRDAKSLPKFDLIVAGGLFDYLEDRVARFVIKSAYGCLKAGGRFFFTNIGRNPYRPWMEYCGAWFLRERDEPELRSLAIQSGIFAEKIHVSTETTGLTHLVGLTK
jgi:SAM-dependent methyltransferase